MVVMVVMVGMHTFFVDFDELGYKCVVMLCVCTRVIKISVGSEHWTMAR